MKIKTNIALSDSGFLFNPSTGDSYSVNPIGQEIAIKRDQIARRCPADTTDRAPFAVRELHQ